MDALNKALDALEHNLNQGEYMVECAGTISNKIVGAYLELNDEYQREYFGHEHAKRAQVIAEQQAIIDAMKKEGNISDEEEAEFTIEIVDDEPAKDDEPKQEDKPEA